MSKCECCKEENSNLITYKGYKMCPACYMGYVRKVKVCENNAKYETEIDQLKQQLAETEQKFLEFQEDSIRNEQIYVRELAEKDKEIKSLIVDYEKRISQEQELMSNMEHQLTEKQNTIDEINKEFVQAVHDWKALCAKKDEEIEKLKQQYTILENENGKLTTELIMDKYKKAQKEVSFGKQLAIQELEKVKELLLYEYKKYPIVYDKTNDIIAGALDRDKVDEIIDKQINDLRGEKDVED